MTKRKDKDELRRIERIVRDLGLLEKELLGDVIPSKGKGKGKLDWKTIITLVDKNIDELKKDIETLIEYRNNHERDGRIFRMEQDNRIKLKDLKDLYEQAKLIFKNNIQNAKKLKLDEQILQQRKNWFIETGKILSELNKRNKPIVQQESNVQYSGAKKRIQERKKKKAEAKARRNANNKKNGKKNKKNGGSVDDIEMNDIKEVTQEQLQFREEVDEIIKEQDDIAQDIINMAREIEDIMGDVNVELRQQEKKLDQTNEKIGIELENLKNARKVVRELLKKSGGAQKWCPIMIISVVVLAVFGYLFNMIG